MHLKGFAFLAKRPLPTPTEPSLTAPFILSLLRPFPPYPIAAKAGTKELRIGACGAFSATTNYRVGNPSIYPRGLFCDRSGFVIDYLINTIVTDRIVLVACFIGCIIDTLPYSLKGCALNISFR